MEKSTGFVSIWDGWDHQIFGAARSPDGGYCARGYAMQVQERKEALDRAEPRIAAYIRRIYEIPATSPHCNSPLRCPAWDYEANCCPVTIRPASVDHHTLIYANNILRLTPDQFREIDSLSIDYAKVYEV